MEKWEVIVLACLFHFVQMNDCCVSEHCSLRMLTKFLVYRLNFEDSRTMMMEAMLDVCCGDCGYGDGVDGVSDLCPSLIEMMG
jgi:hypothetical protein